MQRDTTKKIYFDLKTEIESHGATLIAVSKNYPFEDIEYLYELGERNFGESRVTELLEKSQLAQKRGLTDINWHFIGHLQSNKIRSLLKVKNLKMIHSLDSLKLVHNFIKISLKLELESQIKVFLEYKTSFEEEKFGFSSEKELLEAIKILKKTEKDSETISHPFSLLGLMTMAPIRTTDFENEAKKAFHALSLLSKKLDLKLSMGMSEDYKIALLEGSDFIRIGHLIFNT